MMEKILLDNNITNIINCETQFNCNITPSCENIYKLIKIGNLCNLVIYFDVGVEFTNFNSDILSNLYKPNRIHLTTNPGYYNRFKNILNYIQINIEDKIKCFTCTNIIDIKETLSHYIYNEFERNIN